MRCPECGARNPVVAEWCSQCLTPLVDRDPAPADGADAGPATSEGGATAEAAGATLQAGGGRFRRSGEEIEWACARCGTWNPIEVSRCHACGLPLGADADEPTGPEVDATTALTATVLLPGLGHVLAGRPGTGYARILVFLLCLLGGLGLVVAAADAGQSVVPGVVLLLGAVVVWAGSLVDVRAVLARSRRELLDARTLLWLVVGVIGAVSIAFVVTAIGVS